MKNFRRLLVAVLALFIFGTSGSALAVVTASLDRDHIALGESVRLLVQRDGSSSNNSQLDISALGKDFDVLSRSSGTSVQIINGHLESRSQVTLVLAPKHAGTLQIPPLQWDGEESAGFAVTVGGSGKASAAGAQQPAESSARVLLSATLDRPQTWVQAVAVLTVRLATDEALYQASLDLPASKDLLVRRLGQDVQTSETRNGRSYRVIERKYLLFPQRSGALTVDGVVLDALVADSGADDFAGDRFLADAFGHLPVPAMRRSTRPIRLRADPVELTVLPRPATATAAHWLPAQAVSLTESWHPDNTPIRVGEPITRHLHLAASGLTAAQLPDLATIMTVPEGIKAYPDQGTLEDQAQGNSVLASRDQDIALIASRPGSYILPALKLSWWDTEQETQRQAVLPQRTLEILPALAGSLDPTKPATVKITAAQSPAPAPAAAPAAGFAAAAHSPWAWISLVVSLLWVGTSLAWWYSRRCQPRAAPGDITPPANAATIPAAQAFKAFHKACQENKAQAARAALLNWATSLRPEQPPQGLKALAHVLDDPELVAGLRHLDRCCYAGGEWDGKSLAKILLVAPPLAPSTAAKATLPGLYH
jgi:hypothetical protein